MTLELFVGMYFIVSSDHFYIIATMTLKSPLVVRPRIRVFNLKYQHYWIYIGSEEVELDLI